MGQSSSSSGVPTDLNLRDMFSTTTYSFQSLAISKPNDDLIPLGDYTAHVPDECLELIFQRLGSVDRTRCSVVCKRWLRVDGQSRHRLSLNASVDMLPFLPSLFDRFDSVTKLVLRCYRKSISINDETLIMFSVRYRNLTHVKLRGCRVITDYGIEMFAKSCKGLKKFSCSSCLFGAEAVASVLENCTALEELTLKRLRGMQRVSELIGIGDVPSSLKIVCLKDLMNGQSLAPLLIQAKQLKTLKLINCLGDWDYVLQLIGEENNGLNEIHLERIQVSDWGFKSISNCSNLEALSIIKTPCSDVGIISVSQGCKLLRKLHVDGWRTNRITHQGLTALGNVSNNLQELVLIGINPSLMSLTTIASNCKRLERLAICGSDTVRDAEMACIAANCAALKKLCIKRCQISDVGVKALAWGCPNLSKVKVKKCRGVSGKGAEWLRETRKSISVNIEDGEIEPSDAYSEIRAPNRGVECHDMVSNVTIANAASNSNTPLSRTNLGLLACRNFVPCAFRGLPNNNNSSYGNL